jgi:hypothetical protein
MADEVIEGKKTEVLARIERLRELVEEDEEDVVLERACQEIGRSLGGLARPGQGEGESSTEAAQGEAPPSL